SVAESPRDHETLEQTGPPAVDPPERELRASEVVEVDGQPVVVAELPGEGDRLGEVTSGCLTVVPDVGDRAQVPERSRQPAGLALLPEHRHALLVEVDCAVVVGLGERDEAELGDAARGAVVVTQLPAELEAFAPQLVRAARLASSDQEDR